MVRPSKPDGTASKPDGTASKPDGTSVETGWYDRTSGRGLPLARDRSAAEPPAPRFTAILADTAELSHCQERPGLVNLPIGLQGQHC